MSRTNHDQLVTSGFQNDPRHSIPKISALQAHGDASRDPELIPDFGVFPHSDEFVFWGTNVDSNKRSILLITPRDANFHLVAYYRDKNFARVGELLDDGSPAVINRERPRSHLEPQNQPQHHPKLFHAFSLAPAASAGLNQIFT